MSVDEEGLELLAESLSGIGFYIDAVLHQRPDRERILAPLYAWINASAQRAHDGRVGAGAGRAGKAYGLLQGDGHRPLRARLLTAAFPLGIRGINLLKLGPVSPDLSGDALRRNALDAMTAQLASVGNAIYCNGSPTAT